MLCLQQIYSACFAQGFCYGFCFYGSKFRLLLFVEIMSNFDIAAKSAEILPEYLFWRELGFLPCKNQVLLIPDIMEEVGLLLISSHLNSSTKMLIQQSRIFISATSPIPQQNFISQMSDLSKFSNHYKENMLACKVHYARQLSPYLIEIGVQTPSNRRTRLRLRAFTQNTCCIYRGVYRKSYIG